MQSLFLPQQISMLPPAFQMPQPQGMEQLVPLTPDTLQGQLSNFGEQSCPIDGTPGMLV